MPLLPNDRRLPVSVYADLDLDLAGDAVTVRSDREAVRVDVADAAAALRIARTLQGAGAASVFGAVPEMLGTTGINVEIRVARRPVARIGPAYGGNLPGKAVAPDGVSVYPWRFVQAWMRG
ncbi:MAG: hypothetical protein AAGF99_05490 [Bacteroidota bacterium]